MPDNDTDPLGGIDPEALEAWFTDRMEREQKAKDRAKPPKDFADALDRIADAVADKLETRAEARRAEREAEDQPPSRGSGDGGGGFLGLLGGGRQAS